MTAKPDGPATLWVSYAWDDNRDGDVNFVAQELVAAGVEVKLDRWNLQAGRRLWEQIAAAIEDENQSDAWAIYATQASLGSAKCQEEFSYALGRALESRGKEFAVIGLFNGPVDTKLVPAGVKNRLCVSTTDPDWKERIRAAAEGRAPDIERQKLTPYFIKVHPLSPQGKQAIEVRPRAGTWSPFVAAVPIAEKDRVKLHIMHGPAGQPTRGGALYMTGEYRSQDGEWWAKYAQNEATPTQSYYVWVDALPSRLAFGVNAGQPVYVVNPNEV